MRRGSIALLVGLLALIIPAADGPVSWETLLAPYGTGAPIVDGFRIRDIRRGAGNDIVLVIGRPDDTTTVEVHVLPRGAWPGVRESRSFSIGYESPRSTAAARNTITDILAQTIRARDHGLPSPGAIPLRTADATVLPWWLELLRGTRGLLAGISLAMLALLIVVRSPTLGLVATALGAADVAARVFGAPAMATDIGASWTMPTALALLIVALRNQPLPRRDRALAVTVALIALGLRLGLGPWGPLHVNGQGPRFVAGAARDPAEIALYGPGYAEIFAPIAALAPASPDWAIFACNALLSALAAPLVFAIGRLVGAAWQIALAAALLVAVDPVAIRMGATEAYFPVIIFLCLSAGALFLQAAHADAANHRRRTAAALAAAGLFLVQAARVHPSAWGLIACMPFTALAAPGGRFAQRALVLLVGGAMSAGLLIATSAGAVLDVFSNIRGGALMRPLPPPSLWPVAGIGGAAAVYSLLAPQRWLGIPAALCAAALLLTRHGYDQSWIWQQSYDRLYLTLPLLAVVAAVPAFMLRHHWITAGAALALAAAWLQLGIPIIKTRTTDHLEYRWLREQIAALPPDCRIIHLISADKRVLGIPSYVPDARPAVAIDIRQPHTLDAALSPAPCVYYVRTSLCSSVEGRPACATIEDRLALTPVARATFPVLPSSPLLSYDRDPIETVIARVNSPVGVTHASP